MNQLLKLYHTIELRAKSDYLLALLEKHEPLKREFMKKYKDELEEIRLKSEQVYNREALIETKHDEDIEFEINHEL